MQFHDFDSIVVEPCCVKDEINNKNPLLVLIGGFWGNCWDKRNGGNIFFNTILAEGPYGDDWLMYIAGMGQAIIFLLTKAPQALP